MQASSSKERLAMQRLDQRATDASGRPTIGGSFWIFIGVVAGAAVLVALILGIWVFVHRRRRVKKRSRRAGRGDDLSTHHPAPMPGVDPSTQGSNYQTHGTTPKTSGQERRSRWQTLAESDDEDENDAFNAQYSPRTSLDRHEYMYPMQPADYGHRQSNAHMAGGMVVGSHRETAKSLGGRQGFAPYSEQAESYGPPQYPLDSQYDYGFSGYGGYGYGAGYDPTDQEQEMGRDRGSYDMHGRNGMRGNSLGNTADPFRGSGGYVNAADHPAALQPSRPT